MRFSWNWEASTGRSRVSDSELHTPIFNAPVIDYILDIRNLSQLFQFCGVQMTHNAER